MPQLKRDKAGNPYYQEGAGDKVASFIQAFIGTFQAGQQARQQKQAIEDRQIETSMRMTEMYNKMTPDEQKEFIRRYGKNELIMRAAGLIDTSSEAKTTLQTENAAPGAEKQKFKLRKDLYRGWTPEELASQEEAKAKQETALRLARLAVETGETQLSAFRQNLEVGKFDFEQRQKDVKLRDALRNSNNPFEQALGWDKPVDQFILAKLTEEYPDMASRIMQQKFDIGPAAQNAALVRFTNEGMEKFQDIGKARKYAEAMVAATYKGDYSMMDKLPEQDMKTFAAKQLQLGWANYGLNKKQLVQSEAQFKMNIVNSLMQQSGYTLNPDSAEQIAKHVMFDEPLSEGAKGQYEHFIKMAQTKMQNEAEALFTDLQIKRSKSIQESIQTARETINTLLAQKKAGVGTKADLHKQINALSGKIVETVGAQMGLDPTTLAQPVWKEAIMAGVRTMYGVAELGGKVIGDKVDAETSLFGRVVSDALGPQIMGVLSNMTGVRQATGLPVGPNNVVDVGVGTLLTLDSATGVTDWLAQAGKAIPGIRVVVDSALERAALDLLKTKEVATNPATIALIDEKLRAIRDIIAEIRK